jgi:hypothetical protein
MSKADTPTPLNVAKNLGISAGMGALKAGIGTIGFMYGMVNDPASTVLSAGQGFYEGVWGARDSIAALADPNGMAIPKARIAGDLSGQVALAALLGKTGWSAADSDFARMSRKIDSFDFSTPMDKAVFYSGPGQGARATTFAKATGGMTIEMTPGGQAMMADPLFQSLSPTEQFRSWQQASTPFAAGASGTINAFIKGARNDRTFRTIEEPLIDANQNINQQILHY